MPTFLKGALPKKLAKFECNHFEGGGKIRVQYPQKDPSSATLYKSFTVGTAIIFKYNT